jgi:hypothetical protein
MKKFLLITITLIGAFSLYGADAGNDPDLQAAIDASLADVADDEALLQQAIRLSLQPDHGAPAPRHHHGAPPPPPVVHDHGHAAALLPAHVSEFDPDINQIMTGKKTLKQVMETIATRENKIEFLKAYFEQDGPTQAMMMSLPQQDIRVFMAARQEYSMKKEKEAGKRAAAAAKTATKSVPGDDIIKGDCLFCGDEEVNVFAPCEGCKETYSCQSCLSTALANTCANCRFKGEHKTFKPIPAAFKDQADADLAFTQVLGLETRIQLERLNIIGEAITSARGFIIDMARDLGDPAPAEWQLNNATAILRQNELQWRNLMNTLTFYRHHTQGNHATAQQTLDEIQGADRQHAVTMAQDEELIAILLEMLEGALKKSQEAESPDDIPKLSTLI